MEKKFYQKAWFLWVCGILLPPIGIILLWTVHKDKSKVFKGVVTAVLAFWFVIALAVNGGSSDKTAKEDDAVEETVTEQSSAIEEGKESQATEENTVATEEPEAQDTEEPEKPGDADASENTTEDKINIDLEQWPELAKLNPSKEVMLGIYNDYEAAWESYPEDVNEASAYEEQVAKDAAEKYGVTAEQADMIYGYVTMNYDKVVGAQDKSSYKMKFGEFLEANGTGSTIVIKAKIESNLTNKMTIEQNYYNVGDLIKNQGMDAYEEIQYWAVADMQDGSEAKVISFTVPKDVIQGVAAERIFENQLGDYVEDLWILPSLRE